MKERKKKEKRYTIKKKTRVRTCSVQFINKILKLFLRHPILVLVFKQKL
jgi:hypothetical protein